MIKINVFFAKNVLQNLEYKSSSVSLSKVTDMIF